MIGCGSGALLSRFHPQEALTVGVGMVSRGEVALITGTIGLQAGLLSPSLFSVVIVITVVTTIVTPLLLKLVSLLPAREPLGDRQSGDAFPAIVEEFVEHIVPGEEEVAIQEKSHVW